MVGTEKAKVKQIEITRAEGPIHLTGETKRFDNFQDANLEIENRNYTYPKLGYDKHDVSILWEDGTKFQFRLDCQHPMNRYYTTNRIDKTIQRKLKYYLGDCESPWAKENKEFFQHLKDNCEI